jgi:hypothetical protein
VINIDVSQIEFLAAIHEVPGKFDTMTFQNGDDLFQVVEVLKPYLLHLFSIPYTLKYPQPFPFAVRGGIISI